MNTTHEKPWYFSTLVAFLSTDVPTRLGLPPAVFARDVYTLERRLACEGESFLTKTLPRLCRDVDLALQGHVPLSTTAFKRAKRGVALPAFLQGLLKRIFLDTGWVMDEPCIESIRLLRQMLLWCKKIEKGFSDESLQKATADFIQVDGHLPTCDTLYRGGPLGLAKALMERILGKHPKIHFLRPKHGPGAVASGGGANEKRGSKHAYKNLERVFRPYTFFFSPRSVAENYKLITGRIQSEYGLSRTQFVEKDSSGPRTIGLEPAEYMWCQQALKGYLYDYLESHTWTRGRVNFTDQTINRELTNLWSDYDTLDMSKASDRNSLALVKALFEKTWLWPYLQACRTPGTVLPSGEILWFKKFAPMGSAVCFPVQALVFYTLAVAVLHLQGFPLQVALKSVFVYGDDIIVPHGYFTHLKSAFESYGLKFNEDKCCIHGKFRESCGRDAYDTHDVTPVRMRKVIPGKSLTDLIPVVEHANSLMKAGYWSAAREFRAEALRRFPSLRNLRLPQSDLDDLPILHWFEIEPDKSLRIKYKNSMRKVRGWRYSPKLEKVNTAEEVHFLYESLCRRGPVGRLIGPEGRKVRVFDKKYSGTLRKRDCVIPS